MSNHFLIATPVLIYRRNHDIGGTMQLIAMALKYLPDLQTLPSAMKRSIFYDTDLLHRLWPLIVEQR